MAREKCFAPLGQNTLDLKFLVSVLFDINCVQNSRGIYGCYVFCRRLCSDFESDICFVTFINLVNASRHGPPWECHTSEAKMAEGCGGPHIK